MRLSLEREPNFFRAAGIGNISTEVIVGREADTGRVVSTATRAIRRAYMDGVERSLGYLNSLRVIKDAAGSTLLARGYKYLRELHADAQTPYYVTTILDGNRTAEQILTSERAGLPAYVPFRPPAHLPGSALSASSLRCAWMHRAVREPRGPSPGA